MDKKTRESHFCNSLILWCHQESNRGHKDFQSFALPTELWHQRFVLFCECKGMMFFLYVQIFLRKSLKNFSLLHFCYTFALPKGTECSAVGSALRSGRRGRAFESPHSDKRRQMSKIICRFFFLYFRKHLKTKI